MNPFSDAARWFSATQALDRRRRDPQMSRRKRRARSRAFAAMLEPLEDRTVMSVTVSTGTNSINFTTDTGTDNLYLKVASGVVEYNTDGSSTYTSTSVAVNSDTAVTYEAASSANTLTGTLELVGMDHGGGTYTTAGPVEVTGNLTTLGSALTITGSSITVENGSFSQPITICTSSETGPAGALTLTAPSITVGTYDQLLANGSSSSGDGTITLTATDTDTDLTYFSQVNQVADLLNPNFTATISIDPNVVITGGDVSLTATSGDNSVLAGASSAGSAAASAIGSPIANYINQFLSLPISVLVTKATATTEIGQSASIQSSGSVTVSSSATANSTGEATYWSQSLFGVLAGSFAYSQANSDAESTVDQYATITATEDVSITSGTTTTTSGTALVTQNTGTSPTNGNNVQLSGAYNNLSTTSLATVSQGATIKAPQGNMTVSSTADDNNSVNVQTASYQDGRVGLTGAGADVNANVKAYVDGTIVAGGQDTGSQQTINPFLTTTFAEGTSSYSAANQIDYTNNRFVFNTNPGYSTGEPLVYSSGLGGPILGLANNTTYYAIVSDNATANTTATQFYVQLAASQADALSGTFIAFGQYPTIDGIPITNVNTSSSEIMFDFNPGFTEGQTVTFSPASGQFLGYDNSNGSLAGALSGTYNTYKVHIVSTTIDSTDQYTIQLDDSNGNPIQLDDSPYLTTASGTVLRIESFNTAANLLVLNQADIALGFSLNNGDALTHHAGLATDVTGLSDGTTYFAIVDPSEFTNVSSSTPVTLMLASTLDDAEASNPVQQDPTFTWTDTNGNPQTTTIQQVQTGLTEQLSNAVVLNSSQTLIPNGTIVTYNAGGPGTEIGGLQNGVSYQAVVNSSNPTLIYLEQLGQNSDQPVQLTLNATLQGDNNTYTIIGSDGIHHALLVSEQGAVPGSSDLVEGEAVTYTGALGNQTGSLVDGQTYYVHIPNPSYPTLIQLTDSSGTTLDIQTSVSLGSLDLSYMSGSSHTLTPVTSAGINITATLTSQESLSVSSGVGGEPALKNQLPFNTSGDSQTQSSEGAKPSNPASASGSSLFSSLGNLLAITGSFLVESITNSVDAEVGADAVLESSGNITVSSAITEDNQTGDNSTISRPEDSQSPTQTVAVAMLVDSLNNTSTALIDGGGHVDAGGTLSVTSNVTYPWVGQINNPTGFDAATMFGSDLSANILKFIDGTLGFESALVNNWADAAATASEQPADIAGSVNWTNYTNESEARIQAGAHINQDAQYQDPAQSVSVNATTTFEAVNFAGNTSFDFLPADLVTANQTENAGWGGVADTVLGANAGAAEGVGASLIGAVMNNTTLAMVGGPGTQLNFGNGGFSVTADQEVVQVNIGTSGGLGTSGLGAGGKYGANGTFSYFTADTNTLAQVASGTVVTGDTGTNGAVNVNADDTVLLIAVAGAAFKGENLGIGISGVLNDVTRTTQAIIGTNLDDDATPIVTDPSSGSSTWQVAGPVTVSATEDGDVVNFALSGSVSTPSTGGPSGSEAAALPSSFGSWGIGISGDASYTDETDTTLAYINDAGTFSTGAMDVSADDKTVLAGFTGSYAIASLSDAADQGGTSVGIAGSYSEVDLGGSDEAFIQDAQLTVDGALSVEAERDNYLGTLACSVAGSPVDSSLEVAGSASLSFFSGDTEACLAGVSGSVEGALTVTALDDTIYVAIGGPVTSAGSGGLGPSFGYISVEHTLEAYAKDTSLTVEGDVEVEATADTSIGSLGLALGFSPGSSSFNGAGNCAVNTVEMTLEAYIGDMSDIVSSGAVTIKAQDNSYLVSASGGLAVASQSTVSVGAAASYNLINNTIEAYIDDSTVKANGGSMTVSATSSPMLIALAAGARRRPGGYCRLDHRQLGGQHGLRLHRGQLRRVFER